MSSCSYLYRGFTTVCWNFFNSAGSLRHLYQGKAVFTVCLSVFYAGTAKKVHLQYFNSSHNSSGFSLHVKSTAYFCKSKTMDVCIHRARGIMVNGRMGLLASSSSAVRKHSVAAAEFPWACRTSPKLFHTSWAVLLTCTASRRTFSDKL